MLWLKDAKGSYELRGKTLALLLVMEILVTQVSVLAEALGMHVIFYDTITKLPLGNAVAKKSLKDPGERGRRCNTARAGNQRYQKPDQSRT